MLLGARVIVAILFDTVVDTALVFPVRKSEKLMKLIIFFFS